MSRDATLRLWVDDEFGERVDEIDLGARPITVGRGRDCALRLASPFVSTRHATIQPFRSTPPVPETGDARDADGEGADRRAIDARWSLRPLGLNGTRLNGKLVDANKEEPLLAGDEIEIPGYVLRVVDPAARVLGDRYRLQMRRRYSKLTAELHRRLLDRVDLRQSIDADAHESARKGKIRRILVELVEHEADLDDELTEFILRETLRTEVKNHLFGAAKTTEPWGSSGLGRALGDLVRRLCRTLDVTDPKDPLLERAERIAEGFDDAFDQARSRISPPLAHFAVRRAIRVDLEDLVFHLGPLEDLLRLPDLEEIMVVGKDKIFVDASGHLQETGRTFPRDEDLEVVIGRIVNPVGRFVNRSQPIVDARLRDGSRVHIAIEPVSVRGPAITIRKFAKERFTLEKLIGKKTLTEHAAKFLTAAVTAKKNLIISGGTSSGKTTLLNCLGAKIPRRERLVVIEDATELQLQQPNQVVLEAKRPNLEGEGAVTIRDLVRASLRMRPDRILVGECRGAEALDMLQAMNTGHDGSLTTAHANSPSDLVSRLEVMVLEAGQTLPIAAIHRQIAGALHLVVQIQRQSGGQRRVTRITEVVGFDADEQRVVLEDIFRVPEHRQSGDEPELAFTGYLPTFIDQLLDEGTTKLADLFDAAISGYQEPARPETTRWIAK